MIRALRAARDQTGKGMPGAHGPRRTQDSHGPIGSARRIATWKPAKDELGGVKPPARVVIRRSSATLDQGTDPCLVLREQEFATMCKGDELRFRDARDKQRTLQIDELGSDELIALATGAPTCSSRHGAQLYRGGEHIADVTHRGRRHGGRGHRRQDRRFRWC